MGVGSVGSSLKPYGQLAAGRLDIADVMQRTATLSSPPMQDLPGV
jgi:hypothetical protein